METNDIEARFKFYPPPTEERRLLHVQVRDSCRALAHYLNGEVPDGREKSLAITHLEEVMFWANAGLARQEDQP